MTEPWPCVRLGDCVDLLSGFAFASSDYCEPVDGVRLLRGDNVVQRGLRWSGAKHWPATRRSEAAAYELRAGDVVVAMDRPWIEAGLKVAALRADDVPALLVQRVSRLRAQADLDQQFLAYVLYGSAFEQHVLRVQTGTAVPHISGGQIREFVFALPPFEEQRRIAGVLGSLDDLIETNRRLMKSLDGLGAALFLAAWDGEETCPLESLGRITMGQSPPGSTYNEVCDGLPFYQGVRDFGDRYPTPRVFCSAPTRTAASDDILIAVRAPIGDTNVAVEPCAIGRGLAALTPVRPGLALRALRATPTTWSAYEGSGTVFSSISGPDLRKARVPAVFDDHLEPLLRTLDAQHGACAEEATSLRVIRDELLPLLLSGRVRVREVAA